MNVRWMIHLKATICRGLPMLAASLIAALPAVGQLPDPVAHYTFDEGLEDYSIDTAIDSSGNSNNGAWQNTNTDGLSYVVGQIGGAVSLRGDTDDFFRIPSIPQIDGIEPSPLSTPVLGVGITLSAWINVDTNAPAAYKSILMSRNVRDETSAGEQPDQNWGFAWEGGEHIDGRLSGGQVNSNPDSIVRGQWHHVAMVWGNVDDSSENILPGHRIYVDGTRQTEENLDTGVFKLVTSGYWHIGDDDDAICSGCGGREFDGLIDDVAIFGVAFSDADVTLLFNNGLAGIDAAENNIGTILPGDVNNSGMVTIDDFNIIRNNMGLTADARSDGDLNGNARVDLNDFRMWLDVAPAALAAEALASMSVAVPEPSSMLLAVAGAILFLGRQRIERVLPALIAAGMIIPAVGNAQDLLLRVDRGTGVLQLTGTSATTVDLAGYIIESNYGTLDIASGNFTGLRAIDSDYDVAGAQTSTGISELYENAADLAGALEVDDSIVLNLGNFYDPTGAEASGGFGFNAEVGDFTLTYADVNVGPGTAGLVEYVGDRDRNSLVITVNTGTGEATIENESIFDQRLIGYSIVAGTPGILNTNLGTFDGLRNETGGSAFQAPATLSGNALSELDPTVDQNIAGIAIDAGQSYDLGVIGDLSGNLQDLVDNLDFTFLLAGSSELERIGFVKYVSAGIAGDYNNDGTVNAADYTLWRDNLGAPDEAALNFNGDGGGVTTSDYEWWKDRFGNTSGALSGLAGAVQPIPEPSSICLLGIAAIVSVYSLSGLKRERRETLA